MTQKRERNESQIRYMRLLKGMTKSELALKAGMSINTLNALEAGRIRCAELNARRIADALGIEKEWKQFLTNGKFLPIHVGE